jgi:hypothetical protein
VYVLSVLVGLFAAGCPFNVELPDGAVLECESADDCPGSLICTRARFCADPATADALPPELVDSSVTPEDARAQIEVIARFDTSEPLLVDPIVRLQLGGTDEEVLLAVQEESTDRAANSYAAAYRTTGFEPEGAHLIVADLVDKTGNPASNVAVGTVTFDFVAPSAFDTALGPTHVNDEGTAQAGFALDEMLPALPVVEAVAGELRIPLTVTNDGGRFDATYSPTGDETEGPYDLVLSATDAAGNVQPVVLGGVTLDFTPPTVAAQSVPSGAFRFGDTVSVTVELDDAASVPPIVSCTLGDFSLESSDDRFFSFRLQITDQAPEGSYDITAQGALDLAGNELAAVVIGSITVDASPPSITNLTANAERYSAQPGFDTIEIVLDVTDAGGDVVADLDGTTALTCANEMADRWRCTHTVTDADQEGLRFVQIVAADSAGNEALAAIGVVIDRTAPALVADSVLVSLVPAPTSPADTVTTMGVGTVATVSFLTTEMLTASRDRVHLRARGDAGQLHRRRRGGARRADRSRRQHERPAPDDDRRRRHAAGRSRRRHARAGLGAARAVGRRRHRRRALAGADGRRVRGRGGHDVVVVVRAEWRRRARA